MPEFKKASMDDAKLASAKQELDNIFLEHVRTDSGKFNPKGMQALQDNRWELAELIMTVLDEQLTVTDPLPFLFAMEEGQLGDKQIFQELNSALRVVNRAAGGKPISQRLTWKEWDIHTAMKEVAVEIPLEKIAVGRITPSLVVEEMAAALTRDKIATGLAAIDSGVDAVADRTGETGFSLRYTGYTQANFDKAIDGLLDEADSPQIFGRHVALAPAIRAFTGWSDSDLAALSARGLIGTYHGAGVVTLKDQYAKRNSGHVIPKDRVYVAGGTKGAIFKSVDISFLDYTEVDARTATFMAGRRVEWGTLVHDKYRYRVLQQS